MSARRQSAVWGRQPPLLEVTAGREGTHSRRRTKGREKGRATQSTTGSHWLPCYLRVHVNRLCKSVPVSDICHTPSVLATPMLRSYCAFDTVLACMSRI